MKEGFLRRAKLMQPQGSAAKRAKWQARLDYAKRSYDPLRQKMDRRQAYYTGDHSIPRGLRRKQGQGRHQRAQHRV